MKILVTGAAGFIGYHTVEKFIQEGHNVIGLDNINDYYSVDLKLARLKESGIETNHMKWNVLTPSSCYENYHFIRMNLEDKENLNELFKTEKFDIVVNLAAQAGVRYSIENPHTYVQSNIVGFLNILECCRHYNIKHLIYASSSSVYGTNKEMPFSVDQNVDHPISLYAATKKANELMAHTYSHLFHLPTTGLRFFTVYGPWGRPDMAYMLFADAMLKNEAIKVYNRGKMKRDFTYVEDIVDGIYNVSVDQKYLNKNNHTYLENEDEIYNVFNIGNNEPVELMSFINAIEKNLGIKAKYDFMDLQPGDVKDTWADISGLSNKYGFNPKTDFNKGIERFIMWYKQYNNINS